MSSCLRLWLLFGVVMATHALAEPGFPLPPLVSIQEARIARDRYVTKLYYEQALKSAVNPQRSQLRQSEKTNQTQIQKELPSQPEHGEISIQKTPDKKTQQYEDNRVHQVEANLPQSISLPKEVSKTAEPSEHSAPIATPSVSQNETRLLLPISIGTEKGNALLPDLIQLNEEKAGRTQGLSDTPGRANPDALDRTQQSNRISKDQKETAQLSGIRQIQTQKNILQGSIRSDHADQNKGRDEIRQQPSAAQEEYSRFNSVIPKVAFRGEVQTQASAKTVQSKQIQQPLQPAATQHQHSEFTIQGLVQPTPTQGLVQPTLTQGLVQPTPTQGLVQPTPTQGLVQPTPTQGLVQPTPRQGLVQPTPTQGLVQPTLTEPPESQKPTVELKDKGKCDLSTVSCDRSARYREIDGTCNNLNQTFWGQSGALFQRWLPPAYDDSKGHPRSTAASGKLLPGSRYVSTHFSEISQQQDASKDASSMVTAYGQFLNHDINQIKSQPASDCCDNKSNASKSSECWPIAIPPDDAVFRNRTCMEFARSAGETREACTAYREQRNQATAFIDGSQIYGSDKKTAALLRVFTAGKLKTSQNSGTRDSLPQDASDSDTCIRSRTPCYLAGDARVNQWAGLTAMHTLFLREHNRIADIMYHQLKVKDPKRSAAELDEIAYQEARRVVAAQLQVITYKEYLPMILPSSVIKHHDLSFNKTPDYDDQLDPTTANVFASAAFRFGHTVIPSGIQPMDQHYHKTKNFVELDSMFFQPRTYQQMGNDNIIRGLVSEPCQEFDYMFTDQIRDKLFRLLNKGNSQDLVALDIQRGRDHGLRPYNEWRHFCGIKKVTSFSELMETHGDENQAVLSRIYENVDDIDLFVGAMMEKKLQGSLTGPTFACLVAMQFENWKYGDRFWFELTKTYPFPFTDEQISSLRLATLAKVICRNEDIDVIPKNVFRLNSNKVKCADLEDIKFNLWFKNY